MNGIQQKYLDQGQEKGNTSNTVHFVLSLFLTLGFRYRPSATSIVRDEHNQQCKGFLFCSVLCSHNPHFIPHDWTHFLNAESECGMLPSALSGEHGTAAAAAPA